MNKKVCLMVFLFSFLLPCCLFLMLTGRVNIIWHGFGVDSLGNVYIGASSSIQVFKNNEYVDSIKLPQFRSYYFTIQEDTIYLAAGSNVYTFDLLGNQLSKYSDYSGSFYSKLQWKNECSTSDGRKYKARLIFLRNTIVDEVGTIVYKLPMRDFLVKILLYISSICIIVFGIYGAIHSKSPKPTIIPWKR